MASVLGTRLLACYSGLVKAGSWPYLLRLFWQWRQFEIWLSTHSGIDFQTISLHAQIAGMQSTCLQKWTCILSNFFRVIKTNCCTALGIEPHATSYTFWIMLNIEKKNNYLSLRWSMLIKTCFLSEAHLSITGRKECCAVNINEWNFLLELDGMADS